MKEHPILFSGPMVRAILDDRKTQTRRVVKDSVKHGVSLLGGCGCGVLWDLCPYGAPGDRLWVRETWRRVDFETRGRDSSYIVEYRSGGYGPRVHGETNEIMSLPCGWKPSIHMPRWASRITLQVTGVRVERLQDISAKDIIAEGAVDRPHEVDGLGKCPVSAFDGKVYPDLRSVWAHGWNSINGKRHGCDWASNPWVWVVEFRRVAANG